MKKVVGSTANVYIYSGSKVIAQYVNGTLMNEYVYAGSQRVATVRASDGAVTYHHPDHLSERVRTDGAGALAWLGGHFPFGETWYEAGGATPWKFTSYERDDESQLDYAIFRNYSSRLGRFAQADPLAGTTSDPQSMNRYAYTRNDPVNFVDPRGLERYFWDGGCLYHEYTQTSTSTDEEGIKTIHVEVILELQGCFGVGGGGAGGGGRGGSIVRLLRKVGSFIPVFCGGGVFHYGGGHIAVGPVGGTGGGISGYDTRSGVFEGPIVEVEGGEGIHAGYAAVGLDNGKIEHIGFFGAGAELDLANFSLSGIVASPNSVGLAAEGGLGNLVGGVGYYLNVDSITSCVSHGYH